MADGITRIAVEGFKSISKRQSIDIAPHERAWGGAIREVSQHAASRDFYGNIWFGPMIDPGP